MATPINFLMSVIDGKVQGAVGNAIAVNPDGDTTVIPNTSSTDDTSGSNTSPGGEGGLSPGIISIPSGIGSTSSTSNNNGNYFPNANRLDFNRGNLGGVRLDSYESLVSYFSTAKRDVNSLIFGWTNTFQDETLSQGDLTGDAAAFKQYMAQKLQGSSLIGKIPPGGKEKYGFVDGSLNDWANYFTALSYAESSFNPDLAAYAALADGGKIVAYKKNATSLAQWNARRDVAKGLFQLDERDAGRYKFPGGSGDLYNADYNAALAIHMHEVLLSQGRDPDVYWAPLKNGTNERFREGLNKAGGSVVLTDPKNAHIYVMEDATIRVGLSLETESTFGNDNHGVGSIKVAVVGGKVGSAKSAGIGQAQSTGIGANPGNAYVPTTETSHQTIEDEQWNSMNKIVKAFRHVHPHGNVFGADELSRTNTTNSPVDTIALTNQLMSKTPAQPGEW